MRSVIFFGGPQVLASVVRPLRLVELLVFVSVVPKCLHLAGRWSLDRLLHPLLRALRWSAGACICRAPSTLGGVVGLCFSGPRMLAFGWTLESRSASLSFEMCSTLARDATD